MPKAEQILLNLRMLSFDSAQSQQCATASVTRSQRLGRAGVVPAHATRWLTWELGHPVGLILPPMCFRFGPF